MMATLIRLMIAACCVAVIRLVAKDLTGVTVSAFALWVLYSAGSDSKQVASVPKGRLTLSGRHV